MKPIVSTLRKFFENPVKDLVYDIALYHLLFISGVAQIACKKCNLGHNALKMKSNEKPIEENSF